MFRSKLQKSQRQRFPKLRCGICYFINKEHIIFDISYTLVYYIKNIKMSQNLFPENAKKSRRKALVMTILLHILILGGVFYTSLDETSDIKSMIDQWLEKEPSEEPVTMI
ncbi:MAG: hypothetical protein ACI94Y_000946 [Maribacter sp.]